MNLCPISENVKRHNIVKCLCDALVDRIKIFCLFNACNIFSIYRQHGLKHNFVKKNKVHVVENQPCVDIANRSILEKKLCGIEFKKNLCVIPWLTHRGPDYIAVILKKN